MQQIIAKLLQDFEDGKITRRQAIQSLTLTAAGAVAVGAAPPNPPEKNAFKATGVNHIFYQVSDYTKTRDFYSGVFGMQVTEDNGKSCRLTCGSDILIPRNIGSRLLDNTDKIGVDHMAYTIANWDTDKSVREKMGAELRRRGLWMREEKSGFHVKDPDGFDVQIGGKDQ